MYIYLIIFLLTLAGELFLFGMSPRQLASDIATRPRQPPTAYEIATGESEKRIERRILRLFHDMRRTLEEVGLESKYPAYCTMAVILAASCVGISMMLSNLFLVIPLGLLGLCTPLLFAQQSAAGHKRSQSAEIQTGLSIITSSYLRTHHLLSSVAENIPYLHEPLHTVFQRFLDANEFITTNTEKAMYSVKGQIKNEMWSEWCDAMILCLHDHTKQNMLEGILTKMRKMETVQTNLDVWLYEPLNQFFMMVVLLLVNFPIMYFLNADWFHSLLFTLPGKIACAFAAAAMLFALFRVIRAIRPIEYKR